MNPQKLSNQLLKVRQKNKTVIEKFEPLTSNNKHRAFRFSTYSRISPERINFTLWLLLCVPGTTMIIIYYIEGEKLILISGLTCFGMFLLRWLIDLIQKQRTFSVYKKFITTLGFKVDGWHELGSFSNQLKEFYWSKNSTVEINLNNKIADAQIKLVKDALYLFTSNADKKFYEAETGSDGRTIWTFSNELKVAGSSNIDVISDMYVLIHVYLRSIQEKYHCINSVSIFFDPTIFKVNPPPHNN